MRWTVVIPAKSLPAAKSRLAPLSTDGAAHRRLVEAIRIDTVDAARRVPAVARILIVIDGDPRDSRVGTAPDGSIEDGVSTQVEILLQTGTGLDAAVSEGAVQAAATWPRDGVAALVGDLPALRPDDLAAALEHAATVPACFVPDAAGTGTTMLAIRPGERIHPRFGPGSAARHAEHAQRIDAGPSLRHDVDTAQDLFDAVERLGVGPATSGVLADPTATLRSTALGIITR